MTCPTEYETRLILYSVQQAAVTVLMVRKQPNLMFNPQIKQGFDLCFDDLVCVCFHTILSVTVFQQVDLHIQRHCKLCNCKYRHTHICAHKE